MKVSLDASKPTMKSAVMLTLLGFHFISHTLAEEVCSSSIPVDAEGGVVVADKNASCNSGTTVKSAFKSTHDICQFKAKNGECNSNQDFMFEQCASECITDSSGKLGAIGYFSAPTNYTNADDSGTYTKSTEPKTTLVDWFGTTSETNEECSDISDVEECYDWAESGNCYNDSDFMLQNCAQTCMACFSAE